MASEIRVNSITNRSGLGTVTFSDTGVVLSGVSTFSTGIVVAAGSASAPSISPSGDSNTGIFFPAADTVCIGEGGSEVIRVNSSGLVGIGSDSPTAPLNVVNNNASTPTVWLRNTSGGGDSPVLRVQGGANNDNVVGTFEVRDYDGNVDFKVGGTGNITIGTGNLIIGTSGKGIDFSATANSSGTMTSELLSDYEEGTWTPTITFGGGATGLTYARQFGKYVRVGNFVNIVGHFQISTVGSSTGSAVVSGLPFSYAAITGGYFVPMGVRGLLSLGGAQSVSFYVSSGGGSSLPIYSCNTSGGSNANVSHAAFTTNTEIDIHVSYYVN
jgi:hypothetical protein